MRSAGDRRRWVVRALAVIVLAGIVAGAAAVVLSDARRCGQRRSASDPADARRGLSSPPGTPATTPPCTRCRARRAGLDHLSPVRSRATRAAARTATHDGSSRRRGGCARRPRTPRCPVSIGDDRLRTHRRQPRDPARARPEDLPRRLDAGADVPGASARRAPSRARCTHRTTAGASWPATAPCSPRARTATAPIPQGTAFALVTGFTKAPEAAGVAARHKLGLAGRRGRTARGASRSRSTRSWAAFPACGCVAAPSAPGSPGRILARKPGRKPQDVVTTIDPDIQAASAMALGEPAMAGSSCSTRAPARCGRTPGSAWTSPSRRDRRSRPSPLGRAHRRDGRR